MAAGMPRIGGPLSRMLGPRWLPVRVPLALFFCCGGLLAVLPVFGLWMLPLGLMLLAIDVPLLRPAVNLGMIRLRRRLSLLRRRWRARRA